MSRGPADKVWYMARLVLKNRLSGESQTFQLGNRSAPNSTAFIMPILRNVSGFGPSSRGGLPEQTRGTLVIENGPDSIGYERKFTDILNRYAAIRQQVILFAALTKREEANPTFTEIWRGNISRVRQSFSEGDAVLNIDVARADLPNHLVTKVISPEEFPLALEKSLGRVLPLVFGSNREHEAFWYDQGVTSANALFGTCFSSQFTIEPTSASLIFQDSENNSAVVSGASATGTAFYTVPGSGGFEILSPQETGPVLAGAEAQDKILTSVRIVGIGTSSGSYEVGDQSTFVVSVYEMRQGNMVGPRLTSGRRLKIDFLTQIRGSGIFNVDIPLDTAIPMVHPLGYLITCDQTNEAGLNDPSVIGDFVGLARNEVTFDVKIKYTDVGSSGAEGWTDYPVFAGNRLCPRISLFGATITWQTSIFSTNESGLSSRRLTLAQRSISGVSSDNLPRFQNLQPFIRSNGIRDDSSGSITGTSLQLLTQPEHIANMLTRQWSGSSWTQTVFSPTKFDDSHVGGRSLGGVTQGLQRARDVLSEICGNSLCRVTSWNNAGSNLNLGLVYYGKRRAITNHIDDEDIELHQIEILGTDTVVNRVLMLFNRRLLGTTAIQLGAEGTFRNFSRYIDSNQEPPSSAINSQSLYGEAPLRVNQFNFVVSNTVANTISKLFLTVWQHPHIFVTFSLPFHKFNGKLDIYDELYISHPDFPSFYGSTSDAKMPLSGTGAQAVDPFPGGYMKRAQGYFASIEGYDNEFSRADGPKIRITARLLI